MPVRESLVQISLDDSERISGDPHRLPNFAVKKLENAQYGIVGNHSAVQICPWTKKSLRNKGECYKYIFYGIETHSCAQMSPAVLWCSLNCAHCWRPMEFMKRIDIDPARVDPPEKIIEGVLEQRKKLLCGNLGDPRTNKEKFKYAYERFPSHWAISLSGEPTLYPRLPELIKILKSRTEVKSIFLVSNGEEVEMYRRLIEENALPTQLYISMIASNEKLFKNYARSVYPDGWKRYLSSLKLMRKMSCRKVIRLTVLKGINDSETCIKEFGGLLSLAQPDFVEVKSYMFIGMSRKRLKFENMATHKEVISFANRLLVYSPNYEFRNQSIVSRIVLLKNRSSTWEDRIKDVNG